MAHIENFTKAACGHMFKHYERAKEINPQTGQLEYVKFANQQIDPTKTHLNYNLATHQKMLQGDFIRKRCGEVKLQNRADVKVMCSWVLTVPKDLPENEHAAFFKASYEFMSKRYGEENVISAYVHLDETTPHMHFAFIPITRDKKKGGLKVSAKEVVTKTELQIFHKELSKHLEKALGHSVGVLNGATKNGNRTLTELKTETAAKNLRSLNAQIATATEELSGIVEQKSRAAEIKSSHLFGETVKYDKSMLENTRAIGAEVAENLRKTVEKEQALAAREQRLNEMSAEIAPMYEHAENSAQAAQYERDHARELRENEENYIRSTARKMAENMTENRIAEMFGDVADTRAKRLENFCDNIRLSNGKTALQAFNEQEQALKIRGRGR